ncbi:PREDICTED: solute carrier family 7 member 13 isoform X2 [Rhinopithecus bieti]|uniref:solute carrier family 7 member 13 isoform X2 n=1 Tax=Rhinopithecus bieti TaxID=61621 RepID=UPI00083C2D0C|nr:PREDICTED: solute carrier family 7 member 13 isoform X2 [Rhinopithecus bieti]
MDRGKKIQLKRVFGYCWGTSFLLINIIGAGIFVFPKGVLAYSCMNVGVSLCVWAGCAILAMTSTLCSAEISISFPCSGAQYYFLKRYFGSTVAFLNLWTSLFLGSGVVAGQALLLAEYSIQPFFLSCSVPKLPKKCLALAMLWIVGILTSRGVKEVTWLQMASSVLKVSILSFISLTGVVFLVRGKKENVERFQNAFDAEFPDISHLIQAIFQGYFAYSGGGCFTLIADAVAITWANRVFPSLAWIMPFAISTSLFSNLLISIFKSSRPIYLASQEGQLPLLFNTLNSHSSPFTAVLLLVTLGSLAIILTSLIDLINYIFFTNSLWSILLMIGILRRRYQEPNLSIPYKVFLPFPLTTIVIDVGLVVIPLIKSPNVHYVYVLLLVLSGLLLYIPLIHFKMRLAWFEKMTCYLQLLFNICLPDTSEEQMSEVQTVKK